MSSGEQAASDLIDDGATLAVATTDPSVGRSLVDRIRQRHAGKRRHLDRPIPRWEGDVVVRYGPVDKKVLVGLSKRKASATAANADLLVHSCLEVLIRDEDGELQPASIADDGTAPIRFDGRLADLFELPNAPTPRDIVIRMYADTVALGRDAQRILAWQTGEDLDDLDEEEVEDDLGEADAAT